MAQALPAYTEYYMADRDTIGMPTMHNQTGSSRATMGPPPTASPVSSPGFHCTTNGEIKSYDNAEQLFEDLAKTWAQDTDMISDMTMVLNHRAYRRIIGMGKDALIPIFKSLEAGGGPWFSALDAITRAEPVPEAHRRSARLMREDWIKWGRDNGWLPDRL